MLLGVAHTKYRRRVLRLNWLWSKAKVTQKSTRRQGGQFWLQTALDKAQWLLKGFWSTEATPRPRPSSSGRTQLGRWGRATCSPSGPETGVAICSFAMSSVFGKPRAGSGPHSVPLEVNLAILGRRGAGKSGEWRGARRMRAASSTSSQGLASLGGWVSP